MWLDRLERLFGRLAVPHLTVVLVAGFVLFLALTIAAMGWDAIGALALFLLFLSAG